MRNPKAIQAMRARIGVSQVKFGGLLGSFRERPRPFSKSQISGAERGSPSHVRAAGSD